MSQTSNTIYPISEQGSLNFSKEQSTDTIFPISSQSSNSLYPVPSNIVLAARYIEGGQEFQESSVELSKSANNHYMRNGELLVAESDITESTTFSSYRPWPTNAGLIIGQPASTRTGGLDQCDDDNYGLIAASSSSMSVLIDLDITGLLSGATRVAFIGNDNAKWRWGFMFTSVLQLRVRIYNPSNSIVAEVIIGGNFQIGDSVQIFATLEWDGVDATIYAKKWGRSTASGTDSVAAADEFMGGYYFGRSVGAGGSLDSRITINQVAAWDGTVKTPAEGDTMVAAIQGGGLIGIDVATDADVKVRGITAGFYDATDEDFLPEIAGSGAPVFAEDIANPQPITVPGIQRNSTADEYLKTVDAIPSLPEEGMLIIALDPDTANNGSVVTLGQTSTGGVYGYTVVTTNPDRFRASRGGRTIDLNLTNMAPDNDDLAGTGLMFMVVSWNASTLFLRAVQGGSVIGGTSAGYINTIDGTTSELKIAPSQDGKVSFAVYDELIDPAVLAPQLTDFYSPRNVGLSRGSLWYAPGFAVANGEDVTASDVVNLGSAKDLFGEWEVVAGTNPVDGMSS